MRRTVTEKLKVDTDRLYGTLDEAIDYLQEIKKAHGDKPDIGLHEDWWGYEDMDLVFIWTRQESDEELTLRLEEERLLREYEADRAKAAIERAERLEQYNKLKREFGH